MPLDPCSIVILAHNGADFTETCFDSLLSGGELPGCLLFVDNGSTDRTPDLIDTYRHRFAQAGVTFITWRNAENKGCSLARNEAWQRVETPYTVFLDNDTAVRSRSWLSGLQTVFETHRDTALVGPKIVYPYKPHPIQCAGVSISPLGRICFRGRGRACNHSRFARSQPVHALISACWMMRTDLRDSVGYLDELFHPVQYEDLDLCLRARRAGYEVRYEADVEMYHFEGITTASFGQEEYRRTIARNSLKFRERWHEMYRGFEEVEPAEAYRWRRRDELGLTPELDLALIQ